MVNAPEEWNSKYRMIMLGRKQLPEIVESKSTSEERNWAFNTLRQHTEYGTGNQTHGHPTAYITTNKEIDNIVYAIIMVRRDSVSAQRP
jgi:hypothetical protein